MQGLKHMLLQEQKYLDNIVKKQIHPIRPKHLCKQASNVLLPSCLYSARSPTNPNL